MSLVKEPPSNVHRLSKTQTSVTQLSNNYIYEPRVNHLQSLHFNVVKLI